MLAAKNFGGETIRERLAMENIERVALACTGAIRGSAVHLSDLRALSSISVAASWSSWASRSKRVDSEVGTSTRLLSAFTQTLAPYVVGAADVLTNRRTALKLWTR